MSPSVSPEADRELTEGAIFYAREANTEVGLAFIAEFERALTLLCGHPQLGESFPTVSSTTSGAKSFA